MDQHQNLISKSLQLPEIKTLDDLSNTLKISKKLIYVLSKNTENYYNQKIIKKKNGDDRIIFIPVISLKIIQKWILLNVLEKVTPSDEAMAFRKGEEFSVKQNAERHKYNPYLLKLDFINFFPNINRNRIYKIFIQLGYNALISNIFTNLCTYQNSLPQGAVTSPYLSNLVCFELDQEIQNICSENDITYTRYADDLIFSSDTKTLLPQIYKELKKVIIKNNFKINYNKTKFRGENRRKTVTGITINQEQVNAPKKIKRNLRSLIYNSIREHSDKNHSQIIGYISYINYIENKKYIKKMIFYIKAILIKELKLINNIDSLVSDLNLFQINPTINHWIKKNLSIKDIKQNLIDELKNINLKEHNIKTIIKLLKFSVNDNFKNLIILNDEINNEINELEEPYEIYVYQGD